MPPRLLVFSLFFYMIGALSAQTAGDALTPEFPVDTELYALMTDHLGTDTGPESICGIGSVIGRPFVATRVVTSLQKDTASTAESLEAPHSYLIARDRFGRVRCEIGYLQPDFGPVHMRVKLGTYVYDPVGQTHTSIYPESFHSAFVIPFTLMDPIFVMTPDDPYRSAALRFPGSNQCRINVEGQRVAAACCLANACSKVFSASATKSL
jgi:hypothetical protein